MNKSKDDIYDLTPMTMLDYPGHLACIVWFSGCSMQCSYCYNPSIVFGKGSIHFETIYTFLKKRQGLLDGVVLSGGECTLHPDIDLFCREIKKLGFKIKVDTNGAQPEVIKRLVANQLIDFVALDYKAPEAVFEFITGVDLFKPFSKTLDFLIDQSQIDFEVRTTVHRALLDEYDVNTIINDLYRRGYRNTYFIQRALDQVETISTLPEQSRWLDIIQLKSPFPIEVRAQ